MSFINLIVPVIITYQILHMQWVLKWWWKNWVHIISTIDKDVNPYIELTLYSSAEAGVSEKDVDGVTGAVPDPTPLVELSCDSSY